MPPCLPLKKCMSCYAPRNVGGCLWAGIVSEHEQANVVITLGGSHSLGCCVIVSEASRCILATSTAEGIY